MRSQVFYSPMPDISLGDMERVIEISVDSGKKLPKRDDKSIESIVESFMLDLDINEISTSDSVDYSNTLEDKDDIKQEFNDTNKNDEDRIRAEIEEQARVKIEQLEAQLYAKENELKLKETEAEHERQARLEAERQRQLEAEKAAQVEKQRQLEIQRQHELEEQRKRIEAEKENQRQLEEQRRVEEERQRQLEIERKQELEKQAANERKRNEKLNKIQELERLKSLKNKASKSNITESVGKKIKQEIDENVSEMSKYSGLDADALYKEVRVFAEKRGLTNKVIDKKLLNDTFGKSNIDKLIVKSYLIQIGTKGVTFGNVQG